MAMYVYPRKSEEKVIEKLDRKVCAERIIEAREKGLTKKAALGEVLQGSDDVQTFNEVWKEVEAERVKLASCETPEEITEKAVLISAAVWNEAVEEIKNPKPKPIIVEEPVEEDEETKVIEGVDDKIIEDLDVGGIK